VSLLTWMFSICLIIEEVEKETTSSFSGTYWENKCLTKSKASRVRMRHGSSIRMPFLAVSKDSDSLSLRFCDFRTTWIYSKEICMVSTSSENLLIRSEFMT
jgi:hypothetical protein